MQHGAYKPHKTVVFYGSDSRQQLVESLVFTGLFFFYSLWFILEISVFFKGSLSIVGVGFVKVPPQFYEKGPFYV